MASDKHSKTEKPTPKRKREARREGQVARSQDLVVWGSLLAATFFIGHVIRGGRELAEELLLSVDDAMMDPDPARMMRSLGTALRGMLVLLAPVFAGLAAVAVAANLTQTGAIFTTKPLRPQFKRLNPMTGIKRMLSIRSLWELGKSVLKLAVLFLVAAPIVVSSVRELVAAEMPLTAQVGFAASRTLLLVRNAAAAALVISVADWVFQKRRLGRDLMMSKQEVREEHKQQEGNPEMKAKIRGRQIAMSRNRMIAQVADADVVVVNPVHIAVALRYEPARGAPRVVAKGSDEVAERIKAKAEEHGVPIVESIPLARALFGACELDQEIPVQLYEGVARLLAFVHRIKARGASPLGGGLHRLPGDSPVLAGT